MKLTQIMTLTALIVASASALHSVPPCQAGNMPAGERKEQSNMSNMKVIMLIEAKIQPQRRAELIEAAQHYIPLVRAEPGVEAFYLSTRQDDQIHSFFTRCTSHNRHRTFICSRTSPRDSWQP